jgi:integrase
MFTNGTSPGRKIQHSFDVADNKSYQAVLFQQILREFSVFSKESQTGISKFESLKADAEFFKFSDRDIACATQELKEDKKLSAASLVIHPNRQLSASTTRTIIAIRGALTAYYYLNQTAFPRQLAKSLSDLFICKSQSSQEFAGLLSLKTEKLIDLHKEYEESSPQFRLISNIINALQFFEKDIAQPDASSNTNIDPSFTSIPTFHSTQADTSIADKSAHHNNDLLKYHMSQLPLANRKQLSGIANLYQHYHPKELTSVIQNAYRHYLKTQSEDALGFLLGFFFRVHAERFDMLKYGNKGGGIWIEVENGFLCWNRSTVIGSKHAQSVVRIPLPIEIADAILSKYASGQVHLGQIFNTSLKQLKREVRAFSWRISSSCHKPFLTRLYSAYGRYVLDICNDENYAAAMTADFSIGPTANFNYMVLKAERLNLLCRQVYQGLGFSGNFKRALTEDVGSQMGMQADLAIKLISKNLQRANDAHARIHNRSTFNELIVAHNSIMRAVTIVLVAFLALRKAREYSLANHTLDLDAGLALISDKASTTYLTYRLVPIPSLVIEWLCFYKSWLQSLARRLSHIDKKLALNVATVADTKCDYGSIPLLFYFDKKKIKPVGSRHVSLLLKDSGFESNFGRHLIDKLIRDEAGSVLINAYCGRANPGQEAFGERSGLSVSHAHNQLRNILDNKIQALMLPKPPSMKVKPEMGKASKLDEYRLDKKQNAIQPSLDKRKLDERCPFHEETLIHRRYYQEIVQAWFRQSPSKTIGTLIISLVICDGVLHVEELTYAVRTLLAGNIYIINQLYFIDVSTEMLGIRRVQLSKITMQILSAIGISGKYLIEDISAHALPELTSLSARVSGSEVPFTLIKLLEIAQDYYSTYLPGPLREWMAGRQHSRTLYPAALARHQLDLSERMNEAQSHFRQRTEIKSNDVIQSLLRNAIDGEANQASNDLRLKVLSTELNGIGSAFLNIEDRVLGRYIVFLCTECSAIKSPRTVYKYHAIVKSLLAEVIKSVEYEGDLFEIDWNEVYGKLKNDDQESKLAAINYFFRLYGLPEIERIGVDNAVASRSYIDCPSEHEVCKAISLIQNADLSPWHRRASNMLSLMNNVPLRREDIIHLRVNDVVGDADNRHIVITRASGGTRKSLNAERVLFLNEENADALRHIQLQRQAVSDAAAMGGLFQSPEADHSFGGTTELLDIVDQALKNVSGSKHISLHSLRAKVLTRYYLKTLGPNPVETDVLKLRNRLYELSAEAGHADPNVTIKNYVYCFDALRRQWVDHLIMSRNRLHPHFLSGLLDISLCAATKKLQRHFGIVSIQIKNDSFRNRLENFSKTLHKRQADITSIDSGRELPLKSLFRFVYFRQKTNNLEAACLHAGMRDDQASRCERAFSALKKAGCIGDSVGLLTLGHYKCMELSDKLSPYITRLDPMSFNQMLNLVKSLRVKGSWWLVQEADLEIFAEVLLANLTKVGISTWLKIPLPDKDSQLNLHRFYDLGYRNTSSHAGTKFPRKGIVYLSFKSEQNLFKAKDLHMVIGYFMIAMLLDYMILTFPVGS